MERGFDSGWIGAGPEDDLDRRLAAEEEPFDLRRPHVMTVLGPIEPGALGVTLLQTHLVAEAQDAAPAVDPGHMLLTDLEDLYAAGGRAVVAAATGADRDVGPLLWAAARAPVHVVATTSNRANSLAEASTGARSDVTIGGELAAGFVRELTVGIVGTAARAGAITVGTDGATTGGADETILRAAAQAHAATGAPVMVRLARAVPVASVLTLLVAEGVAPKRIVVVPDGAVDVEDLLASLGDRGVFVALGPGGGGDGADGYGWRELAGVVAGLVAAGLGDRLLLAGGPTRSSPLEANGGWALAAALDRLPLALMDAGLDAPAVRRLVADNPARALTIGTEAE